MHHHNNLGDTPFARKRFLVTLIATRQITFGGYSKGKIYGTLSCGSGKRMKAKNRVFFKDETEAVSAGYRPCSHCMPAKYKAWKTNP